MEDPFLILIHQDNGGVRFAILFHLVILPPFSLFQLNKLNRRAH